jgi:hypothetical protein
MVKLMVLGQVAGLALQGAGLREGTDSAAVPVVASMPWHGPAEPPWAAKWRSGC